MTKNSSLKHTHIHITKQSSLFNKNSDNEIAISISFEKTVSISFENVAISFEFESMRCLGGINCRLSQLVHDSPLPQPPQWRPASSALSQARIAVVVDFLPKYF